MNLRQINISFLVFICMGCFACVHNPEYRKNQESHPLEADFARLDSIFYTGDSLTLNLELDRIRPLIPKRDIISWSNYYMYRGGLIIDPRYGDHYVDSALNLFDNHKIQQQYQKEEQFPLHSHDEVIHHVTGNRNRKLREIPPYTGKHTQPPSDPQQKYVV